MKQLLLGPCGGTAATNDNSIRFRKTVVTSSMEADYRKGK